MENSSTTPIAIAVLQTTPFSFLSMPKVNINATYDNCLKILLKWKYVDTPHTEKCYYD